MKHTQLDQPEVNLAALQSLGLTCDQIIALTRQGFVASDSSGSGGSYYKLRFRFHGKQIVRCIGRDEGLAERVRVELEQLQKSRQQALEHCRQLAADRKTLRASKARMQDLLAPYGLVYHGFTIRRRRRGTMKSTPAGARQ